MIVLNVIKVVGQLQCMCNYVTTNSPQCARKNLYFNLSVKSGLKCSCKLIWLSENDLNKLQ